MATYSTNEFKGGLKIMLDGDPYAIVENEFVKPGKGQAFNRVKVRNLKSGRVIERTFRSGETVEAAELGRVSAVSAYRLGRFEECRAVCVAALERLGEGDAAQEPQPLRRAGASHAEPGH